MNSTPQTSEEVVEAVARAIDEALPESDKFTLAPSQIRRAARAAIAAMPSIPQESDAEVTGGG